MIAILGSGFGLYGFLPALVQGCGQTVALPERYRDRLAQRPELAAFAPHIRWFADEQAALEAADGVVMALRPGDQAAWLPRCLALGNLQRLLLEKPLAPTPQAAAQALQALDASGKAFALNYSFAHLRWRDRLRDAALQTGELTIDWQFGAHHFRTDLDTWKRRHSQGGGVIRFYGIHLIALLAELGYDTAITSHTRGQLADEPAEWQAVLGGTQRATCRIHVDSRATETRFCVTSGGETLVDLADPFDEDAAQAAKTGLDRRVPVLTQVALTLWQPSRQPSAWYAASIRLWQAVEDATQTGAGGDRGQEGH